MYSKLNVQTAYGGSLILLCLILFHLQLVSTAYLLLLLINALSIFILVLALLGSARFYVVLSLIFITGSILIGALFSLNWFTWLQGASYMLRMILFISFVPLIAIPVKNYIVQMQMLIELVSKKISRHRVCKYVSFTLANFINMASLPICTLIFCGKVSKLKEQKTFSIIILRSFALAMLCTPIGAAVALAVDISGGKILNLLFLNIGIAFVGLWILDRFFVFDKKMMNPMDEKVKIKKTDFYLLIPLIVPFIIYFFFLISISTIYAFSIMDLILITIIPYTFLWNLYLRKPKDWLTLVYEQIFTKVPSYFGQFSVIISSGFFIHTVKISGLDQKIILLMPGRDLSFSALVYIPVVIFLILFLAWIGVHQFVALAFVGELFDPNQLGINETVFASTLLVGFVAGTICSSFSGANLIIGQMIPQMRTEQYAIKNYKFTLILIIISTLILVISNSFASAK